MLGLPGIFAGRRVRKFGIVCVKVSFFTLRSHSPITCMASSTALPLKVTPATPAKISTESETADKTPLARKGTTTPKPTMGVTNISSPHELTAFVCVLSPWFSNANLMSIRLRRYWNNLIPSLMKCRPKFWTEVRFGISTELIVFSLCPGFNLFSGSNVDASRCSWIVYPGYHQWRPQCSTVTLPNPRDPRRLTVKCKWEVWGCRIPVKFRIYYIAFWYVFPLVACSLFL